MKPNGAHPVLVYFRVTPSISLPYGLLASQTTRGPQHFNATPANVRTRAVQGRRRYARTRRRSRLPTTSRALATFSGGGSWAEPLGKTAPRRIPTEAVQLGASPSGFGPPPLVPGLFWFRARVILLPEGPTRPSQPLLVPGQVPTFPHPEPPLLFVVSTLKPDEPHFLLVASPGLRWENDGPQITLLSEAWKWMTKI